MARPCAQETKIAERQNRRIVLKSRPVNLAGPENFAIEQVSLPEIAEGSALLEIEMAALSAWQGMRTKDFKNFIRPFDIGELISCDTFGKIVQSRCGALPVGATVVGRQGWQDYAVVTPADVSVVDPIHSAEEWLTALSSPGQTPYLAFSQKAKPMPGDTLVVTSAAGAVGSYTVQLGRLAGARVVGIAGGNDKIEFVRNVLGADAAVDYRAPEFREVLAEACPDGVDLYFDLVGGDTADAVLENLAKRAEVLLVGRVAANNSPTPEWDPANMRHVWSQEATIHAFNRYAYKDLYPWVIGRLGTLLRSGRLTMHNNVEIGLEATPATLNAMLSGKYIGKVLVRFGEEDGTRL
ncbi:MAG: zinc-binding dehydrogenase [Rhizobiaceae bacterium]